jgi:hypothetical protein
MKRDFMEMEINGTYGRIDRAFMEGEIDGKK